MKVGDKVKIDSVHSLFDKATGVIVDIDDRCFPIHVKFDKPWTGDLGNIRDSHFDRQEVIVE